MLASTDTMFLDSVVGYSKGNLSLDTCVTLESLRSKLVLLFLG